MALKKEAAPAGVDSSMEAVRRTDPPGPNSRTATVVSAAAVAAVIAAIPKERMDFMAVLLERKRR